MAYRITFTFSNDYDGQCAQSHIYSLNKSDVRRVAMKNLSPSFPDNNEGVKETKSSDPKPTGMATTDSANDIEYSTFLETITDKTSLTKLSGKSKYLLEQRPRHSKTDYDTYVIINLTVNRIRNVDSKTSSVDARFIMLPMEARFRLFQKTDGARMGESANNFTKLN